MVSRTRWLLVSSKILKNCDSSAARVEWKEGAGGGGMFWGGGYGKEEPAIRLVYLNGISLKEAFGSCFPAADETWETGFRSWHSSD